MITDPESKLLIVILVLLVILMGLAAFLFYMERRLSRSEKVLRELRKKGETNSPGGH